MKELILSINNETDILFREELSDILGQLYNDSIEEDPTGSGIDIGSLQSCVNFFRAYPKYKRPMISLTPNNDIYVSWRGPEGQLFSLDFIEGLSVGFVLFIKINSDDLLRISGRCKAMTYELMNGLEYFLNRDWMLQ